MIMLDEQSCVLSCYAFAPGAAAPAAAGAAAAGAKQGKKKGVSDSSGFVLINHNQSLIVTSTFLCAEKGEEGSPPEEGRR